MTIFNVAIIVAIAGLLLLITGLRQQNRFDITNIPLVSATGKQFFGGAMMIIGIVVLALSTMRS